MNTWKFQDNREMSRKMAGEEGIEPSADAVLETAALPLSYTPNWYRLTGSNRPLRVHSAALSPCELSRQVYGDPVQLKLVPATGFEPATDPRYERGALPG